jgi:uncharacterized protein (TIGR03067 family)
VHKYVFLVVIAGLVIAADAKDDDAKKEPRKFQGTWRLASGEKDSKKIADEHVKKSKITWEGNKATLITPHQSKKPIKATITLYPRKKQMTGVRSAGPGTGKKMHAIYKFINDDEYHICFAPAGKERPKKFATKEGSEHILHVWKRVKE